MFFRDIRHQERALSILQHGLHSGRLPHAFLFFGPEGVGKERTAIALAARLLCLNPPNESVEACGACPSCRAMSAGHHPDFLLLHRGLRKQHPDRSVRTSKGLFLVVDLVRHFLIEPAGKLPTLGARRVFVIRDAERMNEEAQNALLKTLEEPPGNACLVLVTRSAERLLPTIRSRCAAIQFGYLPEAFVAQELSRRAGLTREGARRLAELSEGQLGSALQWNAAGLLNALPRVAELVRQTVHPEIFAKGAVELATDLAAEQNAKEDARDEPADADPVEPADDAGDASEVTGGGRGAYKVETDQLRDGLRLVLRVFADELRRGLSSAAAQGAQFDSIWPKIERGVRGVQQAEWMLERNVSPQLALEALAIELAK